jgi:hypothetical protein
MSSLVGEMETSWLNRTYPREEYIRDGEWEELTDDVFDCVVVYSDTDRPETVTVNGRTWTADITFGENRVILDVTGKIGAAAGLITGSFMSETWDRSSKMKEGKIEAHLKRQRQQPVRYAPA